MSEFGTGLVYCLGLFLEHTHHHRKYEAANSTDVMMWLRGASDHLIDMNIPDSFPEDLRKKLQDFKDRMIDMREGNLVQSKLTDNNIVEIIYEVEKLLMMIDQYLGVRVEEAEWS